MEASPEVQEAFENACLQFKADISLTLQRQQAIFTRLERAKCRMNAIRDFNLAAPGFLIPTRYLDPGLEARLGGACQLAQRYRVAAVSRLYSLSQCR